MHNHARQGEPTLDLPAQIRSAVLELTLEQGGGYLSQACSSAEIFAALYATARMGRAADANDLSTRSSIGRQSPGARYHGPRTGSEDRIYVSPAHYAVVVYATLAVFGRLDRSRLSEFNTAGSPLEMIGSEDSPGMELTTGSFGQALSQVAGSSAGRRLKGESGRSFVFMSDGELQEGQTWEALATLSHHKLGEVVVIVDVNNQQVDGAMEDVFSMEPIAAKLESFGADVRDVDGHDLRSLVDAIMRPNEPHQPVVVLARTDSARGVETLRESAPNLHYVRISSDQMRMDLEHDLAALRTLQSTPTDAGDLP